MKSFIALIALVGAAAALRAAGPMQQAPAAQIPFQVVTTPDYEGAIIPAAAVPAMLKPRFGETWTPTPVNVALAERHLRMFLQRIAKNPKQASDIIQANQEITFEGVPKVNSSLRSYKRQYIGLAVGEARTILVHGLLDDPSHAWRSQFRIAFESGCEYWWYEFSMKEEKVLEFTCQGVT